WLRGVRARSRRPIADAGGVTLIRRSTHDRGPAGAGTGPADVRPDPGGAVDARRPIRPRGVRARPGRRIADAGSVTLVRRFTHDRDAAGAGTSPADVRPRTCVAVVARRPVRLRGIRARPGRRIADARRVTLIQRRTHDRGRAGAGARPADVR